MGVHSLTLLAFGVAGQGVDTDTKAESLRSVILTLVLKHEPTSEMPGRFVNRDFWAPLQTSCFRRSRVGTRTLHF